jgi:hypothetical protein
MEVGRWTPLAISMTTQTTGPADMAGIQSWFFFFWTNDHTFVPEGWSSHSTTTNLGQAIPDVSLGLGLATRGNWKCPMQKPATYIHKYYVTQGVEIWSHPNKLKIYFTANTTREYDHPLVLCLDGHNHEYEASFSSSNSGVPCCLFAGTLAD